MSLQTAERAPPPPPHPTTPSEILHLPPNNPDTSSKRPQLLTSSKASYYELSSLVYWRASRQKKMDDFPADVCLENRSTSIRGRGAGSAGLRVFLCTGAWLCLYLSNHIQSMPQWSSCDNVCGGRRKQLSHHENSLCVDNIGTSLLFLYFSLPDRRFKLSKYRPIYCFVNNGNDVMNVYFMYMYGLE